MIRRWLRRGTHAAPLRREHPSWPPPDDPFLWNQPTQIMVQLKSCCGAVLAGEDCDCAEFVAGTGWYR